MVTRGASFFMWQRNKQIRIAKVMIRPCHDLCPSVAETHQHPEYYWKNCFAPGLIDRYAELRQPVIRGDVYKPSREQGEMRWMTRYLRRQQ
jgi:hypothetical protein